VQSVTFRHLPSGNEQSVTADYVLDATELGELLPLARVEYVTGAESRADTGEPHAVAGAAQPHNAQSLTWCFPMAWDPETEHVIDKPSQYGLWREAATQQPHSLTAWASVAIASMLHPNTGGDNYIDIRFRSVR
jgi:hypothetical protein